MYVRDRKTAFPANLLRSFHKSIRHTITNTIKILKFLHPQTPLWFLQGTLPSHLWSSAAPGPGLFTHVASPRMPGTVPCTSCGCAFPRSHFLPSTQDSRLPLESTFCRWVDVPKCLDNTGDTHRRRTSGRCLHFGSCKQSLPGHPIQVCVWAYISICIHT